MLACPAIPGNLILVEGTVRAIATALEGVLGDSEAARVKAAEALARIEAQEGLGEAAPPRVCAEVPAVEGIAVDQVRSAFAAPPLLHCMAAPRHALRCACLPALPR